VCEFVHIARANDRKPTSLLGSSCISGRSRDLLQEPSRTVREARSGRGMGQAKVAVMGMRRREFITLLGGAAAAWPLAARAQQEMMPVVGLLRNTPSAPFPNVIIALRRGLNEVGFVDRQNVLLEQRWAEGHDDRLPTLLADLVGRKAAVIVAKETLINAAMRPFAA
jgi:hypothetical protein